MSSVKVLESEKEVVIRVELPSLKKPGAMFQVNTAAFKDGVLEVVMHPSDAKPMPETAAEAAEKPVEIFPE
jgi:HSP20 family molecular chaperone IbpA